MRRTLRTLGFTLAMIGTVTTGAVAKDTSPSFTTATSIAMPDAPDKPVSGLDLGSSR